MYNTLAPISNFVLQWLSGGQDAILPQPVRAFLMLPLALFAVVVSFRILWSLH